MPGGKPYPPAPGLPVHPTAFLNAGRTDGRTGKHPSGENSPGTATPGAQDEEERFTLFSYLAAVCPPAGVVALAVVSTGRRFTASSFVAWSMCE